MSSFSPSAQPFLESGLQVAEHSAREREKAEEARAAYQDVVKIWLQAYEAILAFVRVRTSGSK